MSKIFLVVFPLICCFSWCANLVEAGQSLPRGTRAELVVVEKSKRELTLFAEGKVLKVYKIALGKQPKGPKEREGDGKTPEGLYFIDYRKHDSNFYRALHISYPNKDDSERARKMGVSPGNSIMIHGLRKELEWVGELHRMWDWTEGCVAVTNEEIDELWRVVPDGTLIEIKP
ncbi:MAG TPA: L,D-transpeptidase family protein [Geobacteraceae bacterium]|nr:L,D-transpeptidase family protein [Geobacteraceae bacterium]